MKKILLFCIAAIVTACCSWSCNHSGSVFRPDTISPPPLEFNIPQAERSELDNGIVLYVLPDHELPLVNVSVIIRSGKMYDPVGKEGLAELTATVMRTGGTNSLTGDEIDEALDFMAAEINFAMETDICLAQLSALKENWEKTVTLLAGILMQPAFETEKLEQVRQLKLEELRRIHDNPQIIAFREFKRLFYGDNPRGRLADPASVKNLTRKDLRFFHERFFFPANIMIAVTGDITSAEAIAAISETMGNWKNEGSVETIPLPPLPDGTVISYLPKDSPQSILIIGHLAPGKKSDDFYPFEVLDFILGSGGFRSYMFNEIRNNLGLAYSTGSFYSPKMDFGVFGAYAFTKTSSTIQVLEKMREIIENFKHAEIRQGEIEWARNSITNSFIFSFTSAAQIALQQMLLEYHDLPQDFLSTYCGRIQAVTAEDLDRVADRYLASDNRLTFILGKGEEFEKPLAQLGKVNIIEEEIND